MRILFIFFLLVTISCNENTQTATPAASTPAPWPDDAKTNDTMPANKPGDDKVSFDKYCNARFDYCIEYAAGTLIPQPESDNGDGRIFNDKNELELMRVYGILNQDAEGDSIPLSKKFQMDQSNYGTTISYKAMVGNYFVITGERGGKLYYQKTVAKPGGFATAILNVNKDQAELFKLQSEKIFQSFK